MSAVSICVSLRCVGWADKSEDGEGQAPVQALQKPGLCLGRLPGNVWTSSRALLLWGFYHSHSPFHPLVTPVELWEITIWAIKGELQELLVVGGGGFQSPSQRWTGPPRKRDTQTHLLSQCSAATAQLKDPFHLSFLADADNSEDAASPIPSHSQRITPG